MAEKVQNNPPYQGIWRPGARTCGAAANPSPIPSAGLLQLRVKDLGIRNTILVQDHLGGQQVMLQNPFVAGKGGYANKSARLLVFVASRALGNLAEAVELYQDEPGTPDSIEPLRLDRQR